MTRLDSLTGLRFFAALYVVLHHAVLLTTIPPGAAEFLDLGYTGVGFFFVLSGFVLAWSARDGDTVRGFYRRRAARVLPLHFLFLVPGAVLAAAGLFDATTRSAVLSATLLQTWWPSNELMLTSLNPPGWSLSDEVFFYAVFPLLAAWLAARRSGSLALFMGCVVLGMAVVLAVAWSVAGWEDSLLLTYFFPPYRIGEFAVGVALALLMRRRAIRFPPLRVSVAASTLALVAIAILDAGLHRGAVDLAMLPLWGAVIGSAAQLDLSGGRSWLRHRVAVKLGVWSFALYLAHYPIVMTVLAVSPTGLPDADAARFVGVVLYVAASIAVAGAAHRFVERPLERRLRGTRRLSAIQQQDAETAVAAAR